MMMYPIGRSGRPNDLPILGQADVMDVMAIGKILVVDDSVVARRILTGLLTHAGHTVATAETGEEALRRLPELQPDLVVVDIRLPGIDGYELSRRIRHEPSWSTLP